MNVNNLLDLYTGYLPVTPSYCTATGLSPVTGNKVGHDQVTRLSSQQITSKTLWQGVKPLAREIRSSEGLLIIDDSMEPKPFTRQNALVSWHYGHCSGKSVKGVNFVSSSYYGSKHDMGSPVGVDCIKKNEKSVGAPGKVAYESKQAKNEMMRSMVKHAGFNIGLKHLLADSWYSSSESMACTTQECSSGLIMAIKSNRVVALSGDGSTGTLYLATSGLSPDYQSLATIHEKRWKVEGFFRSIKNNATFAKAPTKTD